MRGWSLSYGVFSLFKMCFFLAHQLSELQVVSLCALSSCAGYSSGRRNAMLRAECRWSSVPVPFPRRTPFVELPLGATEDEPGVPTLVSSRVMVTHWLE